MTSVAEQAPVAGRAGVGAASEIVREIARGGLAGLAVGVVVIGIGGRVVMRLAALLVPASAGSVTENGNRIGDITLDGSVALIVFAGLLFGLAAGVVWVVIAPWIPGTGIRRALLAMPIAITLAGFFLIQGDNPDFAILQHNVLVVGLLLGLLGLVGFAVARGDDLLDRRLPHVGTGSRVMALVYSVLTGVGLLFLFPVVAVYFSDGGSIPVAVALLATGGVTVVWWVLRLRGRQEPPRNLVIAGRAALLVAVIVGSMAVAPEVADALAVS